MRGDIISYIDMCQREGASLHLRSFQVKGPMPNFGRAKNRLAKRSSVRGVGEIHTPPGSVPSAEIVVWFSRNWM
jgi:hypothetical protein